MTVKKRTQSERKADTSARLIEAAIDSLLAVGYADSSVKEICNRAGVTTGAIQHNFGSKNALMIAVVERLFRSFDKGITPLGAANAGIDERIDHLVDHYWDVYINDRYYAVCEVLLAVRRDPELLRLNTEIRQKWLGEFEDYLRIEFPDAKIRPNEMRAAAQEMIDFLRGFCLRRIYRPSEETEAAAKRRARKMIADAFI